LRLAEAAKRRQDPHRLEQVRLALRVRAVEDDQARVRVQARVGRVAPVADVEIEDAQGG
jgi:hypothetical protein